MRKGAKRKLSQTNESQLQSQTMQNQRAKRLKASKCKPEPEYFQDKRSMEDLWKAVFPVGTEMKWDFSNLENAFEEGGILHDKQVYLFGCTETQLVSFKWEMKSTHIIAVVAVVSPFPPSDKIGITSVQKANEEIVPMKQMKMDWFPYFPLEKRDNQVEKMKPKVFILGCNQRKLSLKHLKIEQVKKYDYCLPYFYNPLKKDDLEENTEVQIIFPAKSQPEVCEFGWEMDDLEGFIDDLVKDEKLSEDQKDAFKEFVKEMVREGKKANKIVFFGH